MAKISNSNTKAEILKAYSDLLKELQQERQQNSALQKEIEKKQSTVDKVAERTKEGATQSVQKIRELLGKQLDAIEAGIAQEQANFEELKKAIAIEKEELEDLYKIKKEAESLDALIIANKKAKEQLEEEIEEEREQLQEDIEALKIQWKREQEEYDYNLKIKRRKEQDEYNEKKAKQEKELAEEKAAFERSISEREKAVAEQEEELKHLRKEVSQFDAKMEKAVADTEKAVTERLTKEFEYKQQLEVKDLQGDLKLRDQMIENLNAKVKEQQELINTLSTKSDSASQQVKDIAMKAIENSGVRAIKLAAERNEGDKRDKD